MVIYIGADHRGFQLKNSLAAYLAGAGYEVIDMGNAAYDENDDYPDFARAVAQKVSVNPEESRGILICGSGAGMAIAANKIANVRATLCLSPDHAMAVRQDDDTNVLAIAADFVDEAAVKKIMAVWMQSSFKDDPRYARRLAKIQMLELEQRSGR
jgi:ribose 5-phosphate isomerase B